ncbi:MAG: hypothetical protein ACYC6Y_22605, partial [Thermoguttaceae bacterium]
MAPMQNSQVAFVGPEGMMVNWDISMPGQFDSPAMVCPGRYNFPQGAIYRLKLTNIPSYDGVELYPTLEVGPAIPRTQAFLAHNAIPVEFTPSDFEQVLSGNFVTKVIYLPDPEYQELALAGVETLVSTRLDPGVDPIVEADRRGAILGVIRLGNKDLEIPGAEAGAPAVTPVAYLQGPNCPVGSPIGGVGPMGGPMGGSMGGPMAAPMGAGMGSIPMNYISGVTGPEYGMPMCGTPIGLPGPPHIPLGQPATLRKHVMTNHTPVYAPAPPSHVGIHVREQPGYSFPRPASQAWIVGRSVPTHCATGGGLLGRGGLLGAHCDGSCVASSGQPCAECQNRGPVT